MARMTVQTPVCRRHQIDHPDGAPPLRSAFFAGADPRVNLLPERSGAFSPVDSWVESAPYARHIPPAPRAIAGCRVWSRCLVPVCCRCCVRPDTVRYTKLMARRLEKRSHRANLAGDHTVVSLPTPAGISAGAAASISALKALICCSRVNKAGRSEFQAKTIQPGSNFAQTRPSLVLPPVSRRR